MANTTLEPIVLTEDQTLEISALPGIFNYDEKSKLAGQKYRRFKYNDTVFTVNAEHEFCTMYDSENIGLVKIVAKPDAQDPSIVRFELDSAKSQNSVIKMEQFKAKRRAWQFDPNKADETLLDLLRSQSVQSA